MEWLAEFAKRDEKSENNDGSKKNGDNSTSGNDDANSTNEKLTTKPEKPRENGRSGGELGEGVTMTKVNDDKSVLRTPTPPPTPVNKVEEEEEENFAIAASRTESASYSEGKWRTEQYMQKKERPGKKS